jgi:hypothetical protein
MEYNGGSVVAMVGKNCVAIASDLRLGNQALTIATNFEKVMFQSDEMRREPVFSDGTRQFRFRFHSEADYRFSIWIRYSLSRIE